MRKRERKLQLHRETLHRLGSRELVPADLAQAQGAAVAAAQVGVWTSCIQPNCCGDTILTQGTE